jgi:Protein of unknown function (DUF3800)
VQAGLAFRKKLVLTELIREFFYAKLFSHTADCRAFNSAADKQKTEADTFYYTDGTNESVPVNFLPTMDPSSTRDFILERDAVSAGGSRIERQSKNLASLRRAPNMTYHMRHIRDLEIPWNGGSPLRFIYTDEAGTADNEPVIVVVGLILEADQQWQPALQKMKEVGSTVPEKHRVPDFIFHATQIWGSKTFRNGWDEEARTQFLCDMMAIPASLGINIAVSFERKQLAPAEARMLLDGTRLTGAQFRHARVFGTCMGAADDWLRQYSRPEEVAVLVAEDVPNMRRAIRDYVHHLSRYGITMEAPPRKEHEALRKATSMRIVTPISIRKIVDTVHFAEKGKGPLLQIADACAFGLRRFYAKQKNGERFARAILGPNIDLKVADEGLPFEFTVFMPTGAPNPPTPWTKKSPLHGWF